MEAAAYRRAARVTPDHSALRAKAPIPHSARRNHSLLRQTACRQIINCLLRLRMRLTVFNSVIRTAAKCEGGYREREDRCLKEKLWRKGEGGAHNWGTHKKTTTTEARSYFLPHTFNQDPSRDLDRMSSCGKTYRGEGFRHWLFLSSNGLPKPPCPCHALPQRAQAGVASFSKRRSSVPVCHFSLNAVRNLDCVPH